MLYEITQPSIVYIITAKVITIKVQMHCISHFRNWRLANRSHEKIGCEKLFAKVPESSDNYPKTFNFEFWLIFRKILFCLKIKINEIPRDKELEKNLRSRAPLVSVQITKQLDHKSNLILLSKNTVKFLQWMSKILMKWKKK